MNQKTHYLPITSGILTFSMGIYLLFMPISGYHANLKSIEKPSSVATSISTNRDINIINKFSISGKASIKSYNTPLKYFPIIITSYNNRYSLKTDSGGRFDLEGLSPGKYMIHSGSDLFRYKPVSVLIHKKDIVDLLFKVTPKPPKMFVPKYTQFYSDDEVSSIPMEAYRFSNLKLSLYSLTKINPDYKMLNSKYFEKQIRYLKPIQTWNETIEYKYAYEKKSLNVPIDALREGLYLLTINAGKKR